ncbi:hypothetical protein AC579_3207 [Pseudocercospora musae]|uniref:Uncharacterized protein n=1 Tax=Pseudocercospora musae TaxID=113226 RepID=A0A139IRX7_9PEZI|nr:hypothetical protein AC579_3207 [Pseudocercospora musae]
MRFTTILLFLLSTTATPIVMNDIEKRWAAGDSEKQIHAGLSHRDMTPAWPVVRDAEFEGFSSATDERSLEIAEKKGDDDGWMGKVLRRRCDAGTGAGNYVEVLRPRKARYYFTSS